jgi:anaerobic ribonucleoside-triphosphate reductase activating protein
MGSSVRCTPPSKGQDILKSSRRGWHDLLSVTDLLLDGPYVKDLTDTSRPWLGSSNQRYHFLTPRYQHLESELTGVPNHLEVRLQPDGQILINGLASTEVLTGGRQIPGYHKLG